MKTTTPSKNLAKNSLTAFFILFLLMVSSAFKATAQQVITLKQAVAISLENNLQVKQAQLNESLEAENLNQARYNRLPNLTTGPQASFNFGRNIDPSTNQYVTQSIFGLNGNIASQVLLYQGGLLKNQILESRLLLDVDKSNTAKIKNDLTLSVVTTYLQVLANLHLLKAATQQVDIAGQALYRAQKNFDVGNSTLADLSQAKATVSTAQLNQTTAQNQLDVSILTLKQYMEFNPVIQITVEKPDISKLTDVKSQYDAQAVYTSALSINPDVHLAELQKQAAYQNIQVAKSYYYPSLVLFGSIGSNYSNARNIVTALPTGGFNPIGVGKATRDTILTPAYRQIINKYPFKQQFSDNFNQSIGLSLQLPIFGKFATRTLVRRARISYQLSEVAAQLAKNNLNKTINLAVLDLKAADRKYQSAQQTYQANKEAYNVIKQRYQVGLVNSLDYNTSLSNLNKSEFDMIQSRYELIFRSKVIDYYLGNVITL